jgi:hypothetical protein
VHSICREPSVRDLGILTLFSLAPVGTETVTWGEELRLRRRSAETRSEPLLSQELMNTIHEL